jgi:micrococcal nuclease
MSRARFFPLVFVRPVCDSLRAAAALTVLHKGEPFMSWMKKRRITSYRTGLGYARRLALIVLCLTVPASPVLAARALPEARIIDVNDGDTVVIRMNGKTYRTRLIGIDAPEMGQEPWGRKAKKHLRELVQGSGGMIQVETDITKYDKYDRLLAYLWLDEKTMINELMLRDGYAVLFTIQPNSKHADRLKKAQYAARENRSRIWGPKGLTERPIEYKKAHPRK